MKKPDTAMNSFDWKKNNEDSIKDRIFITATTTGIFLALKTIFRKRKTTKGIPGCHVLNETCWWNLWRFVDERLCSLQEMDRLVIQQNFMAPARAIKLYNAKCRQKNVVSSASS